VNQELAAISSLLTAFPASEHDPPHACCPALSIHHSVSLFLSAVNTAIADVLTGDVSNAEAIASSLGADPAFQSAIEAE